MADSSSAVLEKDFENSDFFRHLHTRVWQEIAQIFGLNPSPAKNSSFAWWRLYKGRDESAPKTGTATAPRRLTPLIQLDGPAQDRPDPARPTPPGPAGQDRRAVPLAQCHPVVSHGRRGAGGRLLGGRGSRERGRPARLFRRIGNHRKCASHRHLPAKQDEGGRARLEQFTIMYSRVDLAGRGF